MRDGDSECKREWVRVSERQREGRSGVSGGGEKVRDKREVSERRSRKKNKGKRRKRRRRGRRRSKGMSKVM